MKTSRIKLTASALATAICLALATPAQAQPVSNSTLYYRMGGGTPGGAAANGSQIAANLGLSGNLRIGVIPTALPMVADLTGPFTKKHPNVRVSILSRTSVEST